MHRIPRPTPAELDERQREVYDAITGGPRAGQPGASALVDADGRLQGPFNAFLLQPTVGLALQEVGSALRYGTGLTDRHREIAILVVAAHTDAAFERHVHEPIAHAAGLTDEHIDAIRRGDLDHLDQDDALIARAARDMLEDGDVADETLDQLQATLGDAQLFELTTVVGYYRLLALQLRVFRVPDPTGAGGTGGEGGGNGHAEP